MKTQKQVLAIKESKGFKENMLSPDIILQITLQYVIGQKLVQYHTPRFGFNVNPLKCQPHKMFECVRPFCGVGAERVKRRRVFQG